METQISGYLFTKWKKNASEIEREHCFVSCQWSPNIHFNNHMYSHISTLNSFDVFDIRHSSISSPMIMFGDYGYFFFVIYHVCITRLPAVAYNVKAPIILHVGNLSTDNLFTGLLLPSLFHHLQSSTWFIIHPGILFLVFASRSLQLIETNSYIQLINRPRKLILASEITLILNTIQTARWCDLHIYISTNRSFISLQQATTHKWLKITYNMLKLHKSGQNNHFYFGSLIRSLKKMYID